MDKNEARYAEIATLGIHWGNLTSTSVAIELYTVHIVMKRLNVLALLLCSLTTTSLIHASDSASSEELNRWRFGVHYFQGTVNDFSEALTGRWDTIDPNGVRVNLSYLMIERLWDLPLELLVDGGLMWHNEQGYQDNVLQSTLAIKFAWTGFPWNDYIRTRIAISEGLSYVSSIPITEKMNRNSNSSQNLLNYLEPSIALNCGDFF